MERMEKSFVISAYLIIGIAQVRAVGLAMSTL